MSELGPEQLRAQIDVLRGVVAGLEPTTKTLPIDMVPGFNVALDTLRGVLRQLERLQAEGRGPMHSGAVDNVTVPLAALRELAQVATAVAAGFDELVPAAQQRRVAERIGALGVAGL